MFFYYHILQGEGIGGVYIYKYCSSIFWAYSSAVGCPDLAPQTGGWAERIDDRLVVRCNTTHNTWYLTCMGQTWIGNVGNCTQGIIDIAYLHYFNFILYFCRI